MSWKRVLVANRGEIACRVMRSLKSLGIEAAAVFSEADREAPHVALAQAAVCIGPPAPAESYLNIEAIVEAATKLGCEAVHPGYGFLSESPDFARALREAGLVFIGPSLEALTCMGDKAQARELARQAGVSPVPGHEGKDDDQTLQKEALRLGFPLLVKAARGGGGKGMRLVREAGQLLSAMGAARREAESAFGDRRLILEKLVFPARHVEVQIFGDQSGRIVPLLERECSLQRRHQKVIEECPAPGVDGRLRKKLLEAACKLGRAVNYLGAGTVEFLLAPDGSFYFLEMNTRLQVEHGITELVTGLDLVAWQVRVAAGELLPEGWEKVTPRGHAIEARLYGEAPEEGFLPQCGVIERLKLPLGPGIRVDAGVLEGERVSAFYDPLLMKIMAVGEGREEARGRLLEALRETVLDGPRTNLSYLAQIIEGESFVSGATFTHTLEEQGVEAPRACPLPVLALAALLMRQQGGLRPGAESPLAMPHGGEAWPPFETLGAFRITPQTEAP